MSIHLIGLNHRTAPVEIREQLAFTREGAATDRVVARARQQRHYVVVDTRMAPEVDLLDRQSQHDQEP